MATQKITPYQAGYEYAYLKGSLEGQNTPTVDIEATLKTPFKGWLFGIDNNWTRGYNQYAIDVNNAMDEGSNIDNNQADKFGPKGPIGFIYHGGKKSKRRGAQKKRKTRRSRK